MAYPLVLTAMAFPVLGWTKDSLTEKPIHFGFERAIVNRFRLCNFTNYLTIGEGFFLPIDEYALERQYQF
jgi:hypothetical protein